VVILHGKWQRAALASAPRCAWPARYRRPVQGPVLNRPGDRRLNLALDTIAKFRLRFHPETILYLEKRAAQGLSYREVKR
jgi:hypothetical protein